LVVLSVLALAACGGGAQAQDNSGVTIGLALSTLDNPFFVAMKEGVEKAAAELGVSLVVGNAGNDAVVQVKQVRTFAEQHVRAVIVNPVDLAKGKQAADAGEAALIPLVSVVRSIYDANVASEVTSDNVQGGALAAIALGRATDGNVVHLSGIPGASASSGPQRGLQAGVELGWDLGCGQGVCRIQSHHCGRRGAKTVEHQQQSRRVRGQRRDGARCDQGAR
jgi:ribose transport system substrate-binding protein